MSGGSGERSTDPDQIRDEIEATRAALTRDVDRLADRTSPKRVARRNWENVKEKVGSVTERVMGPPSRATSRAGELGQQAGEMARGAGDKARDAAHEVADTVRQAPQQLARKTQGNPVAVGLIAFGAGLLAASLIPETDAERRAGAQIKERAGDLIEPLKEPLAETAQQLKDDLSGSGRDAVQQVKAAATDAVQETKTTAKNAVKS